VEVRDPRLINGRERAFCRRLLEAAARRPGMRKAEIDLELASCRLEFAESAGGGQQMADFFSECVQEATSGSVKVGNRGFDPKSQRWIKITAYPLGNDVSLWETFRGKPDRVKLRHHWGEDDESQFRYMSEAVADLSEVVRCEPRPWSRTLAIDFRHAKQELNGFLDEAERRFERLLAEAKQTGAVQGERHAFYATEHGKVATGLERLLYLALAGGSFVMTLVGLIVPGIPTVPFLLATSYFLARSSEWLDNKLRESVFFGQIVREWEEHHALGSQSKARLIGLTGAIVLVAVIFAPLSPLGLGLLLLVSSLSAYGVYRLPGLDRGQGSHVPSGTPRLALPAS
jgi:uncharacterized membrane protein YbaN (DUF454 family)